MKAMPRSVFAITLMLILTVAISCTLLQRPVTATARVSGVVLELWASRGVVQVDKPLEIRFTARNIRDYVDITESVDRSVMEIEVGYRSQTIMNWSDGREVTPDLNRLELAPGESKTIVMTWVPAAEWKGYPVYVQGLLFKDDQVRQRVQLTICVERCPIK